MKENPDIAKDNEGGLPENGNGGPSGGDAEEPIQPLISHLFRNHPGFIITFAYLFCSAIGLIYMYFLFHHFEINVFDYAEANDFLVAGFKNMTLFIMNAFVIILALSWEIFFARRIRTSRLRIMGRVIDIGWIFVVLLYALLLPKNYSKIEADQIRKYGPPYYTLTIRQTKNDSKIFRLPDRLKIIGTTDKFNFFYDPVTGKSFIIPISQIVVKEYIDKKSYKIIKLIEKYQK